MMQIKSEIAHCGTFKKYFKIRACAGSIELEILRLVSSTLALDQLCTIRLWPWNGWYVLVVVVMFNVMNS